MRIAEISPYDMSVPGGVQSQVRGLAEELRRRGHTVDVIGPGLAGWEWLGPVVAVSSNDAVARVALGPHIVWRLPSRLAGYDVVHVHEPLMPLVSTAATRAAVPVVATLHADPTPTVRRLLGLGYGRSTLRRAKAVTAVSPVAASAATAVSVLVIPNAVDPALRAPAPKHSRSVVFVGRDEPRKGLSVLLAAWPAVRREIPDATLTVISDRSSGPDDITWLGQADDDVRIATMREAAILCAPNLRGESFGMVVAEGLAAGCSVVTSDLEAFRWVAGEHADYVDPANAGQLAGRIIHRLQNPEAPDEQRRGARRFTWEAVGDQYEDVLAGVRRSA